ncbi:MAG TPA: Hsp20/alpha crystallin family protein [Candidatus Acidoferrales bacterium]|nr:Hsp20/alpha crystallin family protein [Candidatus Acidoferrales bacterium]
MSARWRRNKKSLRRFNIFKVFNKVKERSPPRTFRVKSSTSKRRAVASKYNVEKIPEEKLKAPKPLIDVVEENDEIAVFAEFAGFNRENLRINVKNQKLTLSARTSDRKYYKSLNLPKRVIPDTICTTYKNGVLEIRLKKAVEEKAMNKMAG